MDFPEFFERDLNKLIEEISLFRSEEDIWKTKEGITNSAGNLTLHLIGNLNHFIGSGLGKTGYLRNRDNEFSLKNIPRQKLTEDILEVKKVIHHTLTHLSMEDLKKEFPSLKSEERITVKARLINLLTHLNYHLGQINYLRRILNGNSK